MLRFALMLFLVAAPTVAAYAGQNDSTPPGSHLSPPSDPAATAGKAISFTAQDWQELSAARAAAIKAHPELLAENVALMQRIQALEVKLNEAMIKTDPTIAPLLNKYHASRAPSTTAPATSSAPAAPPSGGK